MFWLLKKEVPCRAGHPFLLIDGSAQTCYLFGKVGQFMRLCDNAGLYRRI